MTGGLKFRNDAQCFKDKILENNLRNGVAKRFKSIFYGCGIKLGEIGRHKSDRFFPSLKFTIRTLKRLNQGAKCFYICQEAGRTFILGLYELRLLMNYYFEALFQLLT